MHKKLKIKIALKNVMHEYLKSYQIKMLFMKKFIGQLEILLIIKFNNARFSN
jgi:hypothetical protein